ncbi:MAG: hypothetical protein JWQ81_5935 [Amycolatopsis sp.]|uniref:lanthionine synthetase C family protein n=1 Tax=Amycolatopsis sp. TaxID=37632 RepID=UPI00262F9623|nr:lanthionine synthetase C family protein [Amycolatopsis sp.]MCU1685196.1 hypothetical protein [Amycolatopsis sp.]
MIPDSLTVPPSRDRFPQWSQRLSDGASGIVLLHAEHAHTTGEAERLHPWVQAMMRWSVAAHRKTGLYQGAPAVAFALRAAMVPGQPSRDAYGSTLAALDTTITDLVRVRLSHARARQSRGRLPLLREFDLIDGLTGLGAHLLHRDPTDPLLTEVLTYLVTLTQPVTVDGAALPGWWTSTAPTGQPSPQWTRGHGNLGIAHGIAGPLALLALAHRHGITVDGHTEALDTILDFYDDHRVEHARGPSWPATITDPVPAAPLAGDALPDRPSWCYGTPGIARAHQLAGLALGDRARAAAAEHALAACLSAPDQLALLAESTLCHGLAGAVLTAWRAAADTEPGSPLAELVPHLRARLVDALADNPPAGLGFLEGLAGVVLAVDTTAGTEPSASRWDHCLLIAG